LWDVPVYFKLLFYGPYLLLSIDLFTRSICSKFWICTIQNVSDLAFIISFLYQKKSFNCSFILNLYRLLFALFSFIIFLVPFLASDNLFEEEVVIYFILFEKVVAEVLKLTRINQSFSKVLLPLTVKRALILSLIEVVTENNILVIHLWSVLVKIR